MHGLGVKTVACKIRIFYWISMFSLALWHVEWLKPMAHFTTSIFHRRATSVITSNQSRNVKKLPVSSGSRPDAAKPHCTVSILTRAIVASHCHTLIIQLTLLYVEAEYGVCRSYCPWVILMYGISLIITKSRRIKRGNTLMSPGVVSTIKSKFKWGPRERAGESRESLKEAKHHTCERRRDPEWQIGWSEIKERGKNEVGRGASSEKKERGTEGGEEDGGGRKARETARG